MNAQQDALFRYPRCTQVLLWSAKSSATYLPRRARCFNWAHPPVESACSGGSER